MAEAKLDYYQDKKGDWRWRRIAVNGEITGASSEGYKAKKDCQANASRAGTDDRWEFYKDKRGGFRWRPSRLPTASRLASRPKPSRRRRIANTMRPERLEGLVRLRHPPQCEIDAAAAFDEGGRAGEHAIDAVIAKP